MINNRVMSGTYVKKESTITVGENIKAARKAKGISQKEMAAKFFMNQQQYSRFENGVYELNYDQIIKVCKILDITPNELFGFGF